MSHLIWQYGNYFLPLLCMYMDSYIHRNTGDHLDVVRSIYDSPRILMLDEVAFENGKHSVR